MKYEESEAAPGSDKFDNDELADDVHIRQEYRGIMMYAVFDRDEQVSDEYPPLQETDVLAFARGYSKAVEVRG